MAPILLFSVVAAAICIERGWALQRARVLPPGLPAQVRRLLQGGGLDDGRLQSLCGASSLGLVLAAGVGQCGRGRQLMKEAMSEAIAQVGHDLERYLNSLGVIASVSPLIGLLGTVVGMIEVFSALMMGNGGNAEALAGGISQALITTAAGLTVAIPALILHRFLLRRVDDLVLELERHATHLADAVHADGAPPIQVSLPPVDVAGSAPK